MIIKGKSRSGPGPLAAHLGNAEKNERVSVLETRGTIARDLRGALVEMDALAVGTRCQKPLYHAAISPEPPHLLSDEQRTEAIDALEKRLGFEGHARVVVLHEKLGRQHLHVVWSRIDLDRMVSISDGHNYRKHEEVARDLERRFGHDRVQGAHHERDGVDRPDRTPSRAELRQEERTGIKGKEVKQEITAVFKVSDGPEAFKAGIELRGYILAKGDRRDFVIVDREGGIHSLARRIEGIKAVALRIFMAPLDRNALPNIEQAKELARKIKEAKEEARTEKGYSHGSDYVSQSRAALKEHRKRQKELDAARNERGGKNPDSIEKTDARARLERPRRSAQDSGKSPSDDDPDRQRGAPGGGRTRSR